MSEKKPPICIDFDGVLNTYKGWNGPNELYTPRPGAKEFLGILTKKYEVVIFTTRDNNKVQEWLDQHGMMYDKITNIKIPAVDMLMIVLLILMEAFYIHYPEYIISKHIGRSD